MRRLEPWYWVDSNWPTLLKEKSRPNATVGNLSNRVFVIVELRNAIHHFVTTMSQDGEPLSDAEKASGPCLID